MRGPSTAPERARDLAVPALLLAVCAHVALVTLTLMGRLAFLFTDATHLHRGMDLQAYVEAAQHWDIGDGIYGHGPGFGYRYHPLFAIVMSPVFRAVGDPARLWVVIDEVFVVVNLLLLRKLAPPSRPWWQLACILLVFSPFFLEIDMGNTSFMTASVLLLAYYFDRQNKPVLSGALVFAAIVIKPLGILYLPVLLVQRRFKALAAICVALLVTGLPSFIAHPGDVRTFVSMNLVMKPGWVVHAGCLGFHGFLTTVCVRLSGVPSETLRTVRQLPIVFGAIIVLFPLAMGLLSLRASLRVRHRTDVCVFLWCATILIGYKDIWEHTYSFAVVGLICLWISEYVPARLVLVCSVALALPTLFALYDVAPLKGQLDPESHWGAMTAVLHHATKCIWIAALYVVCVKKALREKATPWFGSAPVH